MSKSSPEATVTKQSTSSIIFNKKNNHNNNEKKKDINNSQNKFRSSYATDSTSGEGLLSAKPSQSSTKSTTTELDDKALKEHQNEDEYLNAGRKCKEISDIRRKCHISSSIECSSSNYCSCSNNNEKDNEYNKVLGYLSTAISNGIEFSASDSLNKTAEEKEKISSRVVKTTDSVAMKLNVNSLKSVQKETKAVTNNANKVNENAKSVIVLSKSKSVNESSITPTNTGTTTLTATFMDNFISNEIDNDENDPYAELEIYLEKVKSEITEVFEQLNITEDKMCDNKTDSEGIKQQIQSHSTVDATIIETVASQQHCLLAQQALKETKVMNIGKSKSNSNSKLDEQWNCMEKFDDLIENEIKKLKELNPATARINTLPVRSSSYHYENRNVLDNNSNGSSAFTLRNSALMTYTGNMLKLEKHSCIPLQSFFNTSTKSLPEYMVKTFHDKKPPIVTPKKSAPTTTNTTKKSNNYSYFNGKKNDYILKIDEIDLLYQDNKSGLKSKDILIHPNSSFETPKNTKVSYSTIWTSDESIIKENYNLDEDNKSTSSSTCEDNSGLLSSGKSRNSLESGSELENTESGCGTATAPKDRLVLSWGKRKTFSRRDSVSGWIRRENVMTQTNPVTVSSINRNNLPNDGGSDYDNDGIDTLSLNESEYDEFLIMMSNFDQTKMNSKESTGSCKTMNNSFSTDSSSSMKLSADNDDEADVVYRNKEIFYSSKSCPGKKQTRNALSFPNNYSDHSKNSYSLPHNTKRMITTNFLKTKNNTMILPKRPFYLPLEQEPFQNNNSTNIVDLPSPSSASLHSGCGNLIVEELGSKSNSAPILLKKGGKTEKFVQHIGLRNSRSQSDRYLAEIEAIEACKWLRAAGFPQYAQMYEDLQFPIDLSGVAKDHPFLENDPLQSLYRRLVALNRCATMRLDGQHKQHEHHDDSDDDSCALSENWTFQPQSRRWSRVGEMGPIGLTSGGGAISSSMVINAGATNNNNSQNNNNNNIYVNNLNKNDIIMLGSCESTPDRLDIQNMDSLGYAPLAVRCVDGGTSARTTCNQLDGTSDDLLQVKFRRTGSERLKDGAKAFLRRVESIKSRRRKRQNRDGVVISGPQVLDLSLMNQKMFDLKCIDISTSSQPSSPFPSSHSVIPPRSPCKSPSKYYTDMKAFSSLDSNKLGSNVNHLSPLHYSIPKSSIGLAPSRTHQKSHSSRSSPLHFFTNHHYSQHSSSNHNKGQESKSGDDSSSICSETSQDSSGGNSTMAGKKISRARRFLQRNVKLGNDTGALSDSECQPMRKNKYIKELSSNSFKVQGSKIVRGGSLNLGKESKRYRENFKSKSFRSRNDLRNEEYEDGGRSANVKTPVARWHSFQNTERPESINIRVPSLDRGIQMASMSCGQLQVIRKLALVTLTGYMERYCPTHRSGWNWELPKFIKKIKAPDYKDKKLFGVPILLSVQRTGYTFPRSMEAALKWLKLNAMDQIGIFRKSGVKSRIAKLKTLVENSPVDSMTIFEDQQAYDVADMVKLYFRELPECLLTTKLSDTFVAIFQHLPVEVRGDALQSAILLLPDENREVLYLLLEFLNHVACNSMFNQMTSSNLSVCWAPSLFHNGFVSNRSNSSSPRRKNPTGIPDAKELSETHASHDCLTYLIQNYRVLFTISNDKVVRCNFGYMEESKPLPLESLGEGLQVQNWCGYLYECTRATLKEGREKSRHWISTTSFDSYVELAYKKVGDGHPLRLWKCSTEVEAPPLEVLNHLLKERHIWDSQLLKWRIIEQLNDESEVFQYVSGCQNISDYCVLRSWRTDLPKGACVIVETSVDHSEAALMLGSVRGVVLASRYLIEPCGSGKSKLMHLSRVDIKGRTPEWYNKCYGHICSQYLMKIRNFFKHVHISEGPESKV